MHWSADFVGLPWKEKGRDRTGIDCWGLCTLVYGERLGIVLPHYTEAYVSAQERAEIDALFGANACRQPWGQVPAGEEREFHIALMRCAGLLAHVGLVIGGGRMLHVERGGASQIESYASGRWRHRLVGFYAHEARHAD
ncbi:NlpC/P60 family protein [Hyphomicrobium sp.]|uniref:NlpC/P60 family protein n=1 Tax=Hyphomicrobium sp. TaxID=82 RepID=UPI00132616B8|nr:NlpC/P60 family protein [Hyphomicrobium sp.]KAB2937398.1 MAG: NlpC/P60 family protein [Hyphomicrobium sp.]